MEPCRAIVACEADRLHRDRRNVTQGCKNAFRRASARRRTSVRLPHDTHDDGRATLVSAAT